MPRMNEADIQAFLEEPHVGVISTLRRNGLPYSVPVWWLYDNEYFWLTGTDNRVWCKQLQKDSRCSLCIEALSPLAGFVAIDGHAELLTRNEFDIWPISRQLAEKYVGRNDPANQPAVDKFFDNMRTEPRLLFRITPSVWRAIDMRIYEGKRSDRDFQASR